MTREETKKNLYLITAFAEGKTIQYYDNERKDWIDVDEDPSYCYGLKWRIKPESKYRPFKSKEEYWNEMLKHKPFGWIREINGDCYYSINIIDSASIYVNTSEEVPYEDAYINFRLIDGQPFGIETE